MISVSHLSKKYSGVEAVKDISFTVSKGEVVGFLGPNGAGKSTTMRILTGYLPASSGEVKVADMDLLTQSLEVRKKIGYMPENVPLYHEMRVIEYLEYRAQLKGIKRPRKVVKEVMEKCEVLDVQNKLIGALSKGYRQRVGLADALSHNPELLILDEPTSGLDPNQIRTVRALIKELGKNHTVLLSTHILSEVEAICDRAMIIHKGKIEASDTLENLRKKVHTNSIYVEVKASKNDFMEKTSTITSLSGVDVISDNGEWLACKCHAVPGENILDSVDNLIKDNRWSLREFRRSKASLEDVFVELTQE